MPRKVQQRRDDNSTVSSYTGPVGEVVVNTDRDTQHVQDGSTAGGFPQVREGKLSKDVGGGSNVTLTVTEASDYIIELTGTLTSDIDVIFPSLDKEKQWLILNNTSGGFLITIKKSGQTGFGLSQGNQVHAYDDGTDIQPSLYEQLTADRALISDSNKNISSSSVTKNQLDNVPYAISARSARNRLHFDGRSGAWVQVTSDPAMDDVFETGGSIRVIFSTENPASRQRVLEKVKWAIEINNNEVRFRKAFGSQAGEWTVLSTINANEIIDLVISMDASTDTNDPRAWTNGVEQTVTEEITPSGSYASDAGDDITIGANVSDVRQLEGRVYYGAVFNVEFTQSDVDEMWQSGGTPYRFKEASQVQLINDVSRNSDFTASGTDWNPANADSTVTHDTTNDELDVTATAENAGADLSVSELTQPLKGKKCRAVVTVESINLDGANNWRLIHKSTGTGVRLATLSSTGTTTKEFTLLGDGDQEMSLVLTGAPSTEASITVSSITYHRIGATAEYALDEGIGFQVRDRSGNGNHGAFNQTNGITWIQKQTKSQVRKNGADGNQTLLTAGHTIPANVRINSITAVEQAGTAPAPSGVYVSTTAGDDTTKITDKETFNTNEVIDFNVTDRLPGQGSIDELFINSDDWGSGTLDVTLTFEEWEDVT